MCSCLEQLKYPGVDTHLSEGPEVTLVSNCLILDLVLDVGARKSNSHLTHPSFTLTNLMCLMLLPSQGLYAQACDDRIQSYPQGDLEVPVSVGFTYLICKMKALGL